jgi:hypothetical protein
MNKFIILILTAVMLSASANAYVIEGSVTVPVLNDDIRTANSKALEQSLLKALKNYFSKLKTRQPDVEVPDVTTEFFKFIRSYKIVDRGYVEDSVYYNVLADVDDVALNDLMYFVKEVVNSSVYNVTGMNNDEALDRKIDATLADYKFNTNYQSDFQANLLEESSSEFRIGAFRKSQAQYYFDLAIEREPAEEGSCIAVLTTKTYSKTKEFQTLKTKSSFSAETDEECMLEAFNLSFVKTLGYVRENFIPLPAGEKILQTITLTAENYDNFATPKKIMEELKKRTFIESYSIKGFSGKKLDVEITTYIALDLLLKKLQSIESEYNFKSFKDEEDNILLDFNTYRE